MGYKPNSFLIEGDLNYLSIFEWLGLDYTVMSDKTDEEMAEFISRENLEGRKPKHFKGCFKQPTFKVENLKVEPMRQPKSLIFFQPFEYDDGRKPELTALPDCCPLEVHENTETCPRCGHDQLDVFYSDPLQCKCKSEKCRFRWRTKNLEERSSDGA